jgi:hypothetical protein
MSPSLIGYQLSGLISLLTTAVICGAWWFAALRKRSVSIFFWLAATHTLSLAVTALQFATSFGGGSPNRMMALTAPRMLVSLALAGLYVMLVRWLVDRLDER